ncbi:MAG: class I SAM-dependent methyltransferase [Bacteroidales bacterium]|nr:class I SAM-dependent methyltransferase [Bacteroidales bacterium]
MIVLPEQDPMGQAIRDFHDKKKTAKLLNSTQYTTEEEFPIKYLFRSWNEMPEIEQKALSLAEGRILDVGAAAGAHSLYLQNKGKDIVAIDNSVLSVAVMKERGLKHVHLADFYEFEGEYDTILLLMNGVGICGTIDGIPKFLQKCRTLLVPTGKILFDSTDLIYLFENEDGSYDINLNDTYYGEIIYKMRYRKLRCTPFNWLYVDFNTFASIAKEYGFSCKLLMKNDNYNYLAEMRFNRY